MKKKPHPNPEIQSVTVQEEPGRQEKWFFFLVLLENYS